MLRLVLFVGLLTGIGWLLAYTLSSRNQKRALLGIGKVLAVMAVAALIATILLLV